MGSLLNVLFGAGVAIAIIAAFWLLASFIADLNDEVKRRHGRPN